MAELHIIFDGPPSHESGRFLECENADGKSVRIGEWRQKRVGFWTLVLTDEELRDHPDLNAT